jgi:hypothetical protein
MGSRGKACHFPGLGCRLDGFGEDERHRLGGEVAALHEPLVVLLQEQRAGEPRRVGRWERSRRRQSGALSSWQSGLGQGGVQTGPSARRHRQLGVVR